MYVCMYVCMCVRGRGRVHVCTCVCGSEGVMRNMSRRILCNVCRLVLMCVICHKCF